MRNPSRREFLAATALAGTAIETGGAKGQQAAPEFDVVIGGGDIIDPSQNLRGIRDVGIRFGQIAAVEQSIAPPRAKQSIDANGKLVTPGLVDLHAHVYPYGSAIGIPRVGRPRSSTVCRSLERSRSERLPTSRSSK